jgi:hypothetical protein
LAGAIFDFGRHHFIDHGRNMHLHEQLAGFGHVGDQQSQLTECAGIHQVQGPKIDARIPSAWVTSKRRPGEFSMDTTICFSFSITASLGEVFGIGGNRDRCGSRLTTSQ